MAALSKRGNGMGAATAAAIDAETSSTDASVSPGDVSFVRGFLGGGSPTARRFPAQVVRCRGGAGDGAVSSAAASCCDRGGRTMNGMMALTSMMTEIT